MNKNINSQKGFSLIGVVVAGAIGSVIVGSLVTTMVGFQNEAKRLNQTLELNTLKSELSYVWSDNVKCEETFAGTSISFVGKHAPSLSSGMQKRTIATIDGKKLSSFNENNGVHVKDLNFQLISGDVAARTFVAKLELIPFDKSGKMINHIKPKAMFLNF